MAGEWSAEGLLGRPRNIARIPLVCGELGQVLQKVRPRRRETGSHGLPRFCRNVGG